LRAGAPAPAVVVISHWPLLSVGYSKAAWAAAAQAKQAARAAKRRAKAVMGISRLTGSMQERRRARGG